MSGISSTLSIARTAIASQQYGLAVTGHNIANVNNPDYSMQTAQQKNRTPALYSGFLFGTGVNTSQIEQNVDTLLENRLTDERSVQAGFEEAEAYMNVIEGYFDENSDASITSIMIEFWNSWHDLSDNPIGSSERVLVFENGNNFASRLNKANTDLTSLTDDINREIESSLDQLNTYSSQIAALNVQITGLEGNRSANDLRDQRNALLGKLGELIDIDTFEQTNGSISVSAANGALLVSTVDAYQLFEKEDKILWQGSYGAGLDITDNISSGKLGGWLDIRDEIIPKVSNELDVLAREMIWAMNYQHSQGAGLEYFSDSVTGEYSSDQSGLFSSYAFGDRIDYTQDFTMWMQDNSSVDTRYVKTQIDMGLSEATLSNLQGTAPGQVQSRYELTVVDSATLGDKEVIETDGISLAQVLSSATDVATALNSGIADQTIAVNNGPSGRQVIEIKDVGGDAKRSAASIAQALSEIDGVQAYASELSVTFGNAVGIVAGIANAHDGDEIQFSLYSDGLIYDQSFTVDSSIGTVTEQFENALRNATESINGINDDQDLYTNGLSLTSSSGRTIGVQEFEVIDNARVQIDTFANFDAGDTVTFTIASSLFGTSAATTTDVSVTLPSDIDTTDQVQMATAFYDALSVALADKPFAVDHDLSSNLIVLRTTNGSDLTVSNGINDTGSNASFSVAAPLLSGTTQSVGDTTFLFNGADTGTYDADTLDTDTIAFNGQGMSATIEETSAAGVSAGVITGTITIVTEPGMTVFSNVPGAGGLFNGNWATPGSSIVTLGGEGGFSGFSDVVNFDIDGIAISYDVLTAGDTTELEFAIGLQAALDQSIAPLGVGLPPADYTVIRNGKSVSIIKNKDLEDPIAITNFVETVDNNATLSVKSGAGNGTSDPQNDLLEAGNAFRNFSTASIYADSGIIKWEKFDADGIFTGDEGLINLDGEGTYSILEGGFATLSFDVSAGTLVAGNTLTINTDVNGGVDPLDLRIKGTANNKNEMYQFSVTSGGKIGELVSENDTLTIEWQTTTASGSFELVGEDPPVTPGSPIEVEVDGMVLKFYDGTFFKGDVFTITTDESGLPVSTNENGKPTGESLSDWHWTQDSFADQFNRQTEGMTASTTFDNRLKFETSSNYNAMTNVVYSGTNGFNEENVAITVSDWSEIDFSADSLQFIRSAGGQWGIVNDPTGGVAVFMPDGGDDDGFSVDFSGDGLPDIEIRFDQKVSGNGFVQVDFEKQNKNDIGFAFSDDSVDASAGLLAAAGINNFFEGSDAMTIKINDALADTKHVAAARINSETGEISVGDNTNAIAMANVQNKEITMKQWDYIRGSGGKASLTKTTLDGYYSTMTGSMGIIARRIKSSKEFADIMVNNLTEQRDSVSAVSLDEEMIKLMQYQHGFSAASKLLTVADEMLNTLISMR